ncbi:hypothetical protein GUJ93_ZPchr0008g13578 [Zizania palustris]|uniref:Uncharacterized protein n=1 Tax=Zizania palustris TaxID=103762 RepID=A0A8J5UW84_ZIZPA|nr:hypothetical protein GUJ93_ZPchr0008g13578 [Zizania palustris]
MLFSASSEDLPVTKQGSCYKKTMCALFGRVPASSVSLPLHLHRPSEPRHGRCRPPPPLQHRRRLLSVTVVSPEATVGCTYNLLPPRPCHCRRLRPARATFRKHNEILELTRDGLAFKGKRVGKVDGSNFILLCDGGLPGECLLARVRRIIDAVDAPCPLAADCGGCRTQSLAHAAQIRHNYLQVRELPMVFSSGTKRWMQIEWKGEKDEEVVKEEKIEGCGYSLGLHAPGFFHKVLHVEKCLLQSQPADKVLVELWLFEKTGWIQLLVSHLMIEPEELNTTQVSAFGFIICSVKHSYWSLLLTRSQKYQTWAKHVYGYEVVPEVIAEAQNNAKLNGISNGTFVQGDLNKINETSMKEFPKPDVIITGLFMKLGEHLIEVTREFS